MKRICQFFYKLLYKTYDLRAWYYSRLMRSCGKKLKLFGPCYIKNPHNLSVGDNVTINDGVYINAYSPITIGNQVSISASAMIVSTTLDMEKFLTKKEHIGKPIFIGNNVQIGAGAIILPGLRIADNVIVGAGSVVTKDVGPNCIVVGNPARMLRKII